MQVGTVCDFIHGTVVRIATAGSGFAAEIGLDEESLTCGDPWLARVRAVNEMGPGPPEWYPTVVRFSKNIHVN